MAKISQLALAGPLSGDELLPILQEGETRRLDVADHLRPYEERADMVIVTAQALVNFRKFLADGVADFAVGDFFSSAETGELRVYQRVVGMPGYEDQGDAAAPVTKSALAFAGDAISAYNPGGGGATRTTIQSRLQRDVWVEDYFEGLSPGDDYRIAFDRAMTAARARGRSRVRIETVIETKSTIAPPSGMSIVGDGKHYYYDGGNFFEGAWIRYTGLIANPALRYGSVLDCGLTEVGIDCRDPNIGRTGISIGSDNNPATKELLFDRFIIFGCGTGVKWGDENAATPIEQCDAITFREGTIHSCFDGFHIDAANAADYSLIERIGFGQLQGTAFKMPGAGFMPIRQCAAGMLYDTSTMFEISGLGPDAMIIEGCQSEGHPGSTFLKVTGTNDERIIHLRNNQINQKIDVTGIHRILAVGNYLNSTVALDGYVRWTGEANGWLGALETPQVTLANGARLTERTQRDAGGQNGRWIPLGMEIEQIPTAGGWKYQGAVRSGILGFTFVPTAEYAAGMYILPSIDNTYAYKCTVGGATGAEPAWPTVVGDTVTSGAATFQCIGAGALMKGMDGVQA
ncbi:MAG TPA: hypothetical protein VN152_09185 [Sphingopyxis sp.]|nr:hypothetical protein [Sphingopyxis sp.]